MPPSWISAETEPKERDFRGILGMHLKICKGIRTRRPGPPYLYIDLHGGPGVLEYEGRAFAGSPLIFAEEASERDIDYRSAHFESDEATAVELARHLQQCSPGRSIVRPHRFEDGLVDLIRRVDQRETMLGLVYSDPINDPIPHVQLNHAADLLPQVDLMAYVSATQYKRRNGARRRAGLEGPRLADDILAVRKRVILIREKHGPWQWTFVVWSNWDGFPEWRKHGFHRLDSARGQQILHELNHTDSELHAMSNEVLPLDPPYRTYREYLRHPRFLRVRARVFERAGGRCERCGLRPPRDPHHLRYPPWGEFDVPENLIAICHECHCEVHGKAS